MCCDCENIMLSGAKTLFDAIFKSGIPIAPFPMVEHCLGLTAKDSSMEIKDGYAIMAFDYHVESAEDDCIFSMNRNDIAKEMRQVNRFKGMKIKGMSKY